MIKLCLGRNSHTLWLVVEKPGASHQGHQPHSQGILVTMSRSTFHWCFQLPYLSPHLFHSKREREVGDFPLSSILPGKAKLGVCVSYNNNFLRCSENESPWTPNSCDLVFCSVGGLSAEVLEGTGGSGHAWDLEMQQTILEFTETDDVSHEPRTREDTTVSRSPVISVNCSPGSFSLPTFPTI